MTLRKNPMIQAWISKYQRVSKWHEHLDCSRCGWPHAKFLLCGSGATFGSILLGEHTYYIDSSNVEYMLQFVQRLGGGFHWNNEIFFDVADGSVIVSRVEPYNNCPHVKKWKIPLREWQSIADFVAGKKGEKGKMSNGPLDAESYRFSEAVKDGSDRSYESTEPIEEQCPHGYVLGDCAKCLPHEHDLIGDDYGHFICSICGYCDACGS